MVISGILLKVPYWLTWKVKKLNHTLDGLVFYVATEHDYRVIENLLPHLPSSFLLTTRSKTVVELLQAKGLPVKKWPAFPEVLVMVRHAFHLFPVAEIKKIGMRHGPYHFKRMINAKKYNIFDVFLFTSSHEADIARTMGIKGAVSGGYPPLDSFKDEKVISKSTCLFENASLDKNKITLLFTSTWDKSGMSAIDRWADKLTNLADQFNIMVSLHPAISFKWKSIIQQQGVCIVNSQQMAEAMLLADFLISDTSSVIAEFCALNKPVIAFRVPFSPRLTPEIGKMISEISLQIDQVDELSGAVERYRIQPDLKEKDREYWNKIIFDDTNISHGNKAAEIILRFLKSKH
ncbi:MAG: hypothetical protein EA361_10830 [Bacteroidetes bacterium]|nr:MAG: hypothetical protein EA361_10830 [Bacteroidota bacterium]